MEQWRRDRDATADTVLTTAWTISEPQRTEDGRVFVAASTPSRSFVTMPYGLRVRPSLAVSCLAGEFAILLYLDPGYLEHDAVLVRWSVDGRPLPASDWSVRRTSYNVFGWNPGEDAQIIFDQLVSAERLDLQMAAEPADIDLSFDLSGLPAVLDRLEDTCGQ